MGWKKGLGKMEKNVIERDKLNKFTLGSLHFFFQFNGRQWNGIYRQVTQAPARLALGVIGTEEKFERVAEVSHLNNTNWHICQDVSPGKKLIYWGGK